MSGQCPFCGFAVCGASWLWCLRGLAIMDAIERIRLKAIREAKAEQ